MSAKDYPEMNETHAAQLRQSLGLLEHEILPPTIVDKYWDMKRIFDRTGTLVQTSDLAMVCFLDGYGEATEKEKAPPTIVDLYRSGKFKLEGRVTVKWGDEERDGVLKRIDGNDAITVQIDGDSEERHFKVKDVRPVGKTAKKPKAAAAA